MNSQGSKFFRLTNQHIQDGHLCEEDFSRAAGFKVETFRLSDFPCFEELQRQQTLPFDKMLLRAEAIYVALQERNLVTPSAPFCRKDADEVAYQLFPTVRHFREIINLSCTPFFQHFGLIRRYGVEKAHTDESLIWWEIDVTTGSTTTDVFPGLLNEDVPVGNIFRKSAAFILRSSHDRSLLWMQRTGIPQQLIEHIPVDDAYQLKSDLHELRHLQQISFSCPHVISNFYTELDAEIVSRFQLKQANVAQSTSASDLHSRYLELLDSSPKYWYAPTMEALECNQQPRDFFETHRAVCEIRLRLAQEQAHYDLKPFSSQELQVAIGKWSNHPNVDGDTRLQVSDIQILDQSYANLKETMKGKNPAPLFTNLRKLVERNTFTDPFSEKLAARLLEAAQHFNADLIYADHEPSRKRMNAAVPRALRLPAPPGIGRRILNFLRSPSLT